MVYYANEFYHHGVKGQKWGLRRYQNPDGSYKAGAEGRYDPDGLSKKKRGGSASSSELKSTTKSKSSSATIKGTSKSTSKSSKSGGSLSSKSSSSSKKEEEKKEEFSASTWGRAHGMSDEDSNDLEAKRKKLNDCTAKIERLNKQIADEKDPDKKSALEAKRDKLVAERKELKDDYNNSVSKAIRDEKNNSKEVNYSKVDVDTSMVIYKNRQKGNNGTIGTDDESLRKMYKENGMDYDKLSDSEKEHARHLAEQYNENGTSTDRAAQALIEDLNGKSYSEVYGNDSVKTEPGRNKDYVALDNALAEANGTSAYYYTDAEKDEIIRKVKAETDNKAKHCYYVSGGAELYHHGILGQKWGVRRYQNKDGTLTAEGRRKYLNPDGSYNKAGNKFKNKMEKKDVKWANKKEESITNKAYKASRKEMKSASKELAKNPMSRVAINNYNRKLAETMNTKVSDIRSPSGKVIKFVAKRGELGVYMGLATPGYDMRQVRNGVWSGGRIAYNKKSVGTI